MNNETQFLLVPSSLPEGWPAGLAAESYLGVVVWGGAANLAQLFAQAQAPSSPGARCLVRAFKPGVTNPMSQSLARVLGVPDSKVRVDRVVLPQGEISAELRRNLEWLWREPAIEDLEEMTLGEWQRRNERELSPAPRDDDSFREGAPADFDLEFEGPEWQALQAEAKRRGRGWNRAELEVFAQTWSEHCKHKIFGARIRIGEHLTDGLFATHIRRPTLELQKRRPGVALSVFHDNAGVLALQAEDGQPTDWAFCLKMETHNSPSAISPYGGASTGIVGVHRDILGTGVGAMPIANWDVLCFEQPDHGKARPANALPAEVVRKGVIKGIEDGGNQSGIPTVQGSVVFDPAFAVKPLVFAGAIGLMPKSAIDKKARPGLTLYCFGGSTGADGLRGAVMSSRDLRTSDFRGSAVQVASAWVQRCLTDFLIEARDAGLVDVSTDNGAGGFASSVGEMASLANGAEIDLTHIRLKFEGLHGWERLLSESQERMTVATSQPDKLEALARRWQVGFDKLGRLTGDGQFRVTYQARAMVDIRLEFLHGGCPRLELESNWTLEREKSALKATGRVELRPDVLKDFAAMLASVHLCSREGIVRRFDHEVQGRTLRKPFAGRAQETPQDGSRIEVYESQAPASIALAHGLSPQRADIVENVAHSFDEAVRQAVLAGIRLDTAGLLDNFCWPDPITRPDSPEIVHRRLWRLVRSNEALSTLCRAFDLPLISGKDSMKNNSKDFAALETLVVSIGGSAGPRENAPAGFFARANDVVFSVPALGLSLRDSAWERALGVVSSTGRRELLKTPADMGELAQLGEHLRARYARLAALLDQRLVRSAKDVSEGGLLTAVFEMALGRSLGVHFESWDDNPLLWFGEGLGAFVLAVDPHDAAAVEAGLPEARRLGVVMNAPVLRWGAGTELPLAPLREAYLKRSQGGFWK